jgi:hypothetical protein
MWQKLSGTFPNQTFPPSPFDLGLISPHSVSPLPHRRRFFAVVSFPLSFCKLAIFFLIFNLHLLE